MSRIIEKIKTPSILLPFLAMGLFFLGTNPTQAMTVDSHKLVWIGTVLLSALSVGAVQINFPFWRGGENWKSNFLLTGFLIFFAYTGIYMLVKHF